MRVCVWRTAVVMVVVVATVVLAEPQGVGIRVNNKDLFVAGLGVLLAGVAFHAGRQSAYNERDTGSRPGGSFGSGGSSGGGSFGFFPFRHRRHATCNFLDPRIEGVLEAALEHDPAGCVLQLTCAVGGIPQADLTSRVKDLHAILSCADGEARHRQGGVAEYQAALSLGQQGVDCDHLFPRCPAPSSILIQQFQTLKIDEYYR